MKRKVLAMLLLLAMVLSVFTPAVLAQPAAVPFVWTVQDQTVPVGTQYVDVEFTFESPGITFKQAFVRWDPTYLRLPANRAANNVFPSTSLLGIPMNNAINAAMPTGLLMQWSLGVFNVTGNGHITIRFEVVPGTPAGTEAVVWVEPTAPPQQNINEQSQRVEVIGDSALIRVASDPFVWTVQDQTVPVGTRYVDVPFTFESPGIVFKQAFVRWDPTYLRLPANRAWNNVFPSTSLLGIPMNNAINAEMPTGLLMQWSLGVFNVTGDGHITIRFEVIPGTPAGTEAAVWVEPTAPPLQNINEQSQRVEVIGDSALIRVS